MLMLTVVLVLSARNSSCRTVIRAGQWGMRADNDPEMVAYTSSSGSGSGSGSGEAEAGGGSSDKVKLKDNDFTVSRRKWAWIVEDPQPDNVPQEYFAVGKEQDILTTSVKYKQDLFEHYTSTGLYGDR